MVNANILIYAEILNGLIFDSAYILSSLLWTLGMPYGFIMRRKYFASNFSAVYVLSLTMSIFDKNSFV